MAHQQDTIAPDVIETILNTRRIAPEQVLDLRRNVWPDDIISRREAEVLCEINDTLETVCAEWRDFFAEAMVAHLIVQAEPRGYIGAADAQWFEERILRDGTIRGETELETLIQLLEKATDAPRRLELLALGAVRDAVLSGEHKIVGNARLRPGVLGDPEVALLRRALYAKASGRSAAISREEAELLLGLNDATAMADNCAAWSALFVNALANYLLVQSGYEPPSRERMKQVDLWLNQPGGGIRDFLRSMVTGFGKNWKGSDLSAATMDEHYRIRLAAEADAREQTEKVDADEAAWLIAHMNRDDALTLNEMALLHFLRESDLEVHPSIRELYATRC